MVFPEPGIGARIFPADLSAFVTDYYRDKGVEVIADTSVAGINARAASHASRPRTAAHSMRT